MMLKCNLSAERRSKIGNCIVLEDFNGHVGSWINGNKGVHKGQKCRIQNKDSERLLEFVVSCDMTVGNMFFKKDKENVIT